MIIEAPKNAIAALVLATGSSTDEAHPHLSALSSALQAKGIMTLRFNFEYRSAGRAFPGPLTESVSDYLVAANHLESISDPLPLFFGGHSYGSRVATHAAVALQQGEASTYLGNRLKGIVGFSLPLHPRSRPHLERWQHLVSNRLPLLVLAGDRDPMVGAEPAAQFIKDNPETTLQWVPGADHGFRQTRAASALYGSPYDLAATTARRWIDSQL